VAVSGVGVRPERAGDEAAIFDLTARAFAPMPYSEGDEQHLIDILRARNALALSLVAVKDEQVIGHVAFSPATAADGSQGWFALGPVSIEPQLQRRGIGSLLIETGLADLRARRAAGCILVGNVAYYARFGFALRADLAPEGYPAAHFMVLPLAAGEARTIVDFDPAFRSTTPSSKERQNA
jgi:putative acetyltransferase